jgi:hypothetical protein
MPLATRKTSNIQGSMGPKSSFNIDGGDLLIGHFYAGRVAFAGGQMADRQLQSGSDRPGFAVRISGGDA